MSGQVDRLRPGLPATCLFVLIVLLSPSVTADVERCQVEVEVPARHSNESIDLVRREASTRIDITPARLVARSSRFLVRDRSSEIIAVQPRLEIETRHREVHPATTVWVRDSQQGERPLSPGDRHDLVVGGIDTATIEAGQCVVEYLRPARVEFDRERVLISEATERLSVHEAEFESVVDDIVIRPTYRRLIEVPTVWRTEMRHESGTTGGSPRNVEIVDAPATTTTIVESAERRKIRRDRLLRDAYEIREPIAATWGAIQIPRTLEDALYVWRVEHVSSATVPASTSITLATGKPPDSALEPTGRRLCHRKVPARTVMHEGIVEREPGHFLRNWRAAEYESFTIEELVSDASQETHTVPALSETIERREVLAEARRVWHAAPCEGDLDTSKVRQLQRALQRAGHEPGAIDGVAGDGTLRAITDWQKANGMASGALTIETLRALGVALDDAL